MDEIFIMVPPLLPTLCLRKIELVDLEIYKFTISNQK
jgi:hypothetical protein